MDDQVALAPRHDWGKTMRFPIPVMALLTCVLGQLPLGAQPRTIHIRKTPKILWKRGPKARDYVPYPNTPFPNVTYDGGPTVAHASYWMVYWGPYWTSGLGLSQRRHFNS
jgi:hypothetical protein